MGDGTSLLPLAFLWQPLALPGCHITPLPLCCLSFPPLTLLLSLPCLLHSPFHSPCVLSVVFGNGVIIGQPVSHFLRWAVCLLFSLSLSFSIPLLLSSPWRLCVTFIPWTHCPSQTLPIMPCMAATYLHPLQLIPITNQNDVSEKNNHTTEVQKTRRKSGLWSGLKSNNRMLTLPWPVFIVPW